MPVITHSGTLILGPEVTEASISVPILMDKLN